MRRSKLKLWAVVFAVLLAFSVVSIITELFGLSVCFFGTPLHAWLALPFCAGSIGLTTCLVIWLKRRKRAGDRLLHTALQVVLCVLCTISVLVAAAAAVLTHTAYSDSDVSGDGAHKAFLETDESEVSIASLYEEAARLRGLSCSELREAVSCNIHRVFFGH